MQTPAAELDRGGTGSSAFTVGRWLRRVLWGIAPDDLTFAAGIVGGVGASVFITRTLGGSGSMAELRAVRDLLLFLTASFLLMRAKAIRAEAQESWRRGGESLHDYDGFLRPRMQRLLGHLMAAVLLIVVSFGILLLRW